MKNGTPLTKASYQDELTLGIEKSLDPTLSIGLKGTYRTLGRTVEDRCDLDGSVAPNTCALFNPGGDGQAASGEFPTCNGSGNPTDASAGECAATGVAIGDAKRIFRGIEMVARKQFTNEIWAQASFLYSSLKGNYSGAIRQATGQTDPGINADYDYYQFTFNDYGNLELDRPVQARIDAVYNAPFGLSAGAQFYVRSGLPISRLGWFNDFYPANLYLEDRGTFGRTPTDYDMNLSLGYNMALGPVTVTPQLYVFNVLNRQTTVAVDSNFNFGGAIVTDPTSPFYGQSGQQPGTGTCAASATAPCSDNPDFLKTVVQTNPRLLRVASEGHFLAFVLPNPVFVPPGAAAAAPIFLKTTMQRVGMSQPSFRLDVSRRMIVTMRRYSMRRALLASFLVLLTSLAFADNPSVRLFLKAKEQFRLAQYEGALATLDLVAAEAEKPGNESLRASLPAGLAFYRGACYAALGRTDEAREKFETFLTYQPNATLDPSAYPPKVIATLDDVRKSMRTAEQQPAETGSLATSFRAYRAPVEKGTEEAGEDWAEGPAGYLLTADQKRDYERLSDPASRSEYIAMFWKERDSRPETPENETRMEFERRVAFADARLSQDETRGSVTDRGMVFVLLGPPTWIGRKPLRTGDDANDPKGMSLYSDLDVNTALKSVSGSAASALVYDSMTGPGTRLPDSDGNYREVWHYRRELLPKGISFHQVDFEFITRRGYGVCVWQREGRTLTTLETARAAVRTGSLTRTASR